MISRDILSRQIPHGNLGQVTGRGFGRRRRTGFLLSSEFRMESEVEKEEQKEKKNFFHSASRGETNILSGGR
jgi:hypothetical protein